MPTDWGVSGGAAPHVKREVWVWGRMRPELRGGLGLDMLEPDGDARVEASTLKPYMDPLLRSKGAQLQLAMGMAEANMLPRDSPMFYGHQEHRGPGGRDPEGHGAPPGLRREAGKPEVEAAFQGEDFLARVRATLGGGVPGVSDRVGRRRG